MKPQSARWRKDMYRQILRTLGTELPIETVNLGTLDRYVSKRRGEGKAYSTINREISVLRHSLHLAARWKAETHLTRYRLTDWIPLREADSARKAVFLTNDQVAAVLAAARSRASRGGLNERKGEIVVRLALETGARLGELLGLTWSDLDGRVLRIRSEKHGPHRSIELSEETAHLVHALCEGAAEEKGLIFPSCRTGIERGDIRRFWHAVRQEANVGHVRFHDLRHTAASEMLRRGLLLREVQYVLGHTTARMTERYAHFAPDFRPPKAITWPVH